jgi:hypothetical protein
VYAGLTRSWLTVLGFTFAQAVVNVYPIMHLRLVRARVARVAGRRSVRRDGPDTEAAPTGSAP